MKPEDCIISVTYHTLKGHWNVSLSDLWNRYANERNFRDTTSFGKIIDGTFISMSVNEIDNMCYTVINSKKNVIEKFMNSNRDSVSLYYDFKHNIGYGFSTYYSCDSDNPIFLSKVKMVIERDYREKTGYRVTKMFPII